MENLPNDINNAIIALDRAFREYAEFNEGKTSQPSDLVTQHTYQIRIMAAKMELISVLTAEAI